MVIQRRDKSQDIKYYGIDIIKVFMAICVVAIHTRPLVKIEHSSFMSVYNAIVSMAVPFFFLITGFLLFNKISDDFNKADNISRAKKYIYKYIQLYLIWSIIYLPEAIYYYIHNNKSLMYNLFDYIRGFLLIGEHYYSWPLWYLLSVIIWTIVIYYLLKFKVSKKTILIISFITFIFANLSTIMVGNIDNISGTIKTITKIFSVLFLNGRLFTGFVYLSLGMIFSKYKINLKKSLKLTLFVLCLVGSIVLPEIIKQISGLVASIFLFQIAIEITLKDSNIYYIMRKLSTVMYFTHMIFFFIYSIAFKKIEYYGADAFVISVLCSVLFTLFIIYIEDRNKFAKIVFG